MSFAAYLRHPALLLAAVSVAIALVWFVLGYPADALRSPLTAGEKFDCVSYVPVPPVGTEAVSAAQITADLARLAPIAGCVRTYATGLGLDRVPEAARKLGMTVLQGIALGRDAKRSSEEIDRAIALVRTQRSAIRAFVAGSEVLSRRELGSGDLAAAIRRVRQATKAPVTYADTRDAWLNAGEIANLVDFISVQVPLYRAEYPVAAADAVRHLLVVRGELSARYPGKEIVVSEVGWPSAGRMRDGALPSPANQARVIHDVIAAGRAGNFRIHLFEGIDQPWRRATEGNAGAHWGLIDAETGALKLRWGAPVSNHPQWFMQGALGVLLACVVFAAAFLAARSSGPAAPSGAAWRPVAVIALAAGVPFGWAVADVPLQSASILEWTYAGFLIALAIFVPPVAAAALVRGVHPDSFAETLRPALRGRDYPLTRVLSVLRLIAALVAIQVALGLVFDPAYRNLPFAPLTGPAAALLVVTLAGPGRVQRAGNAESGAALILAGSALFIAFNETFLNWQALWLSAALLALAAACWFARGARD